MPFILLLFFLHLNLQVLSQTPVESALENRALLAIKSAIVTDPNSTLATWTPATHHCTWTHVTCDSDLHVTSLNFTSLNLSGTLSKSVSNLRHINNITITGTHLTGLIPSNLFLIPTVKYLNLSNNLFNGTFPSQLSQVSNIQVIDLYNNEMTGDLPVSLAYLPNLTHLHLGGNYFTGKIPPEYGQFQKVQYLSLAGNALSGKIPPEIGNVSTLYRLYLGYYNTFSGGIPPEIGNLSNLVRFGVAYTGLTGRVPPELSKLKNLDTLFLQVNNFSGEITSELGSLKGLKSMDLSNNQFWGEIPITFKELKNLTLLNLFRNELHGSIPEFISDLPELEVLQLWENNFTGIIPQNLGLNGKLKIVDVSTNMLTGPLPMNLCNGNRLETLIVKDNLLSGPIPDTVGDCQSISRIRMGGNYFNGTIPKGIFSLPQLSLIELEDNMLSGEFPETYSIQFSLGEIFLSNNKLTGPLPPSIGNFYVVQKLLLDGNEFSSTIPMEIGQLQQLSEIDLSNNNFSGEITPQISKCGVLGYIDLSRNQLSGKIPIEITAMSILGYLNLSKNHLEGTIPGSMATMRSLTSLDLSYNNLSGLVPNTGQFSYFNSSSFIGNPNLCGSSLGDCSGATHRKHGRGFSSTYKLLLVIGLLLLSIAFIIVAIIKGRSIKRAGNARKWKLTTFQRLDFTCDDVLDSLKEDNIIGKGGAGIVYKGAMPSGEQVAVKRFPNIGHRSSHDHGFGAEILTLGKIRHRYIVKLLGFCSNNETNLLIYEYMANGSLGEVLHGKKGGHLHWETRYKIAVEAAKGLCYLHHDCSPLIIHRDVKSNNILLDSDYEAHVADFGLAKFFQGFVTSDSMSAIAGSYGYIAPEYAYTLKVDEKSDVYSFGVVLLELVCGKKAVGEFGDGVDIVQWVKNKTENKIEQVTRVIDSRLPTIPIHEIKHVLYVAMLCVEEQAVERPTMREVVQLLTDVPTPPSKQPQEELLIGEASPSPTHIIALDSPTESLSLAFPRS